MLLALHPPTFLSMRIQIKKILMSRHYALVIRSGLCLNQANPNFLCVRTPVWMYVLVLCMGVEISLIGCIQALSACMQHGRL